LLRVALRDGRVVHDDQDDPSDRPALRWLRLAEEDLTVARHTAAIPSLCSGPLATWAHQAAEKALKALLVEEGVDPPKSHDLIRLSRQVSAALQQPLESLDLAELTRWAIEGRYPTNLWKQPKPTRASTRNGGGSSWPLLPSIYGPATGRPRSPDEFGHDQSRTNR